VFQKSEKRKEEEEEKKSNTGNFPSKLNRQIFMSDMDCGGYLPGTRVERGEGVQYHTAPPNLANSARVFKDDGCPSVFETSTDLKASLALNQFYQPKKSFELKS